MKLINKYEKLPIKSLVWKHSNKENALHTWVRTNETELNDTLIKQMWDYEDETSMRILGIHDIEKYKLFIDDFTIKQNGKILLDGKEI